MMNNLKKKLLLPKPHKNQEPVLKSAARYRVVACGRRFGKTELGKREIVEMMLLGKACWWLAPTYGMAAQVWRELKHACRDLPGLHITEAERRLDLPNGGSVAIRSAHTPDNLRGAGLDFVVIDEAAFIEPTLWPEIIRPMLLERKGHALFLSSPNGKNWFWEIYQQGINKRLSWKAWRFSSFENPFIDSADLEAIRQQTAERIWRAEYLAEFTDDLGQVFRGIRAATTAPLLVEPIPGRLYVAGLDWGKEHDATAIIVIDVEARAVVAIDRFTGVSWSLQRGRLAALYERWRPAVIWAEANSIGSPNVEALQAEGIPVRPFITTASSKPPLIESLSLAIERGDIALIPDETLLNELAAFSMEQLPGGGYRYSAPPGLHDDTVIALCLAWHGLRFSTAPTISFA